MKKQTAAALLGGLVLALAGTARAYPPAPEHQIYGLVRNEFGDPLMLTSAKITLTTTSGVAIVSTIVPGLEAGVNYRMKIPMDAGFQSSTYKSTALAANIPFTIKARIGTLDYVPMELVGSITRLGSPAKSTRMDMTLGVDSDHDGIPDAWEYDLLDWLGNGGGLGDINPNEDSDGDGISNMNEYLAGTYAWDSADGFTIDVKQRANGSDVVEFLAITGRSYLLSRSTDLKTWTPVQFDVPAESATGRDFYPARDVRTLQLHIPVSTNAPTTYTYRAIVQ